MVPLNSELRLNFLSGWSWIQCQWKNVKALLSSDLQCSTCVNFSWNLQRFVFLDVRIPFWSINVTCVRCCAAASSGTCTAANRWSTPPAACTPPLSPRSVGNDDIWFRHCISLVFPVRICTAIMSTLAYRRIEEKKVTRLIGSRNSSSRRTIWNVVVYNTYKL